MILLSILGVLIISLFVAPYASEGFFVLFAFSIAATLANLIANAAMYVQQVDYIERIPEAEARQAIFVEKAKALTEEFKIWLGEKYPDFEKELFKNLIPQNVAVFAVQFPEIKSSETITKLVSKINSLQSDIYNERLSIERYRRHIRIIKRNPFIITKIMPTV